MTTPVTPAETRAVAVPPAASSAVLIVAALVLPRSFGRGTPSLDLITGGRQ